MRVVQIYYPNDGAFNCWEPIVQAELDRLGLQGRERETATIICLPESMKRRGKNEFTRNIFTDSRT